MTKFAIYFTCALLIFAAQEDWIDRPALIAEYANEPHFVEGMPDECMTDEECEALENESDIYEACNELC